MTTIKKMYDSLVQHNGRDNVDLIMDEGSPYILEDKTYYGFRFVILYPEVTVKNTYTGREHTIYDLYIKLVMDKIVLSNDEIKFKLNSVQGIRGKLEIDEFNSSYTHSHLQFYPYNFTDFCLGTSSLQVVLNQFNLSPDIDSYLHNFSKIIILLDDLARTESEEGTPYNYIENITANVNDLINTRQISIDLNKTLIVFLMKFINLETITISETVFKNKKVFEIVDFEFNSELFSKIDIYSLNGTNNRIYNTLINENIIVHKNNMGEHTISSIKQLLINRNDLFIFKNKSIALTIIDPKEEKDLNYVVSKNYKLVILNILNEVIINKIYKKDEIKGFNKRTSE